MKENNRVVRVFRDLIGATPHQVFPLLCPVREYEWIPMWQCELLYSATGVAELGAVFTTDFGDGYGRETWVVSRYEPSEHIAFIKCGPYRTTRYDITLLATDVGTEITWRQELTPLNREGADKLQALSVVDFDRRMSALTAMLNAYLKTGEMMDKERALHLLCGETPES